MAFIQYLVFNDKPLPLPDSYDIGLSDVEADSGGARERPADVVRTGVADISVSFCISKWVKLPAYLKCKIAVVFDTKQLIEGCRSIFWLRQTGRIIL